MDIVGLGRKYIVNDDSVRRLYNVKILIVDDQLHELDTLVHALGAQGARVSVANEPRKGMQLAQVFLPDLILLDVHMPTMDGFATCRLLREMQCCHDVPVIFLTSASNVTDRVNGLTLGGVDYILKPFAVEEVIARILVHVQLAKLAVEHYVPVSHKQVADHPDQIVLQAALRLLKSQLAQLPKLKEIAAKLGTHDKKLSAIFRDNLGMTVFAWVREERLRKAQDLLIRTYMSIEDISAEIGFTSAANFATAYRERFAMTPSAYRKALTEL